MDVISNGPPVPVAGKGKHRIELGADAWLLDKLYRVAPVTTNRLLYCVLQRTPVGMN
jgi:hypothetical protein